jgi:hypothetical protein
MKKTKYLDFYKSCMESGRMPEDGLCICFRANESLKMFEPTVEDRLAYPINRLFLGDDMGYWGSGDSDPKLFEFTPLRQTIVLFLAACSGELDDL